jgi:hypothetical protein
VAVDRHERDEPDYGLPKGKDKEKFLDEMRDRYTSACTVDTLYDRARGDMKFAFLPDEQWDAWMKSQRGERPMMTFNRIRQAIKQVTNDQRQNRPQIKVRPWEESDAELAEVRQGLIRGIEARSNAGLAYDEAFKFAVGGGFGVWRIKTEYAAEDSFEQDIVVEPVLNPYGVKFDPAAKKRDRSDGMFAFVEQRFARQEFSRRWPKSDLVAFNSGASWVGEWAFENEVLVVEYWYVELKSKTIHLLNDGRVVDDKGLKALGKLPPGVRVMQERETTERTVWSCLCSGNDVLEKTRWAGRYIPLIPTWGDIINVDGKDDFCGMVQFSRDAQKAYNFERSILMETIADQPRSPVWATPKQVAGFERDWENMGTRNPPVQFYNPDERVPGGMPVKQPPPAFPAALANAAQMSAEDIKATSGKFDASLGARSNETSGRAIALRQREGDVSSFDYIDNLTYALRHSFEVINDLIPHIYDTERQVRILGEDMAEKVIRINAPMVDEWGRPVLDENGKPKIDPKTEIARGKYDLAVTVGPSFTTQRMEMADAMQSLANDPSPVGMLAKYGFLKSLDAPGMEEMLKAVRKILVSQGLLEPEEGDQPPAPPQPNPKDVADAAAKEASAALNISKAAGQDIQNQRDAFVLGAQMGATLTPRPPPMGPPGLATAQPQGPSGPFAFSGPSGPPSNTAPGGFPG